MATSDTPARGRYFFALLPSRREARALHDAHATACAALDGRPVPPARLHVTLCFIGAADASRLERAASRVTATGFDLVFDQRRYRRRARMLWAAPSTVPDHLSQLVSRLRRELKVEAVAFDDKRFLAHVTVLRKARRGSRPGEVDAVRWRCREFVLMASQTFADGPRYHVCRRWPLARP